LSKASRRKTTIDSLIETRRELKKAYGAQRQAATGISAGSLGGIGSSGGSQAVNAPTSGLLKTAGDTMVGPIAFFPVSTLADLPAAGNNHTLNISRITSNSYSSNIKWGAGGSDQMDIINGAAFAGQVLIIETTETLTQTIRDESNVTGPPAGNIKTLDGGNLVLGTRKTLVMFIFSSTDNFWHQLSNPVGGGGSEVFTWSADHNANNNALLGLKAIKFTVTGTVAATETGIFRTGGGDMEFNVPDLKTYDISINGVNKFTLQAGRADFGPAVILGVFDGDTDFVQSFKLNNQPGQIQVTGSDGLTVQGSGTHGLRLTDNGTGGVNVYNATLTVWDDTNDDSTIIMKYGPSAVFIDHKILSDTNGMEFQALSSGDTIDFRAGSANLTAIIDLIGLHVEDGLFIEPVKPTSGDNVIGISAFRDTSTLSTTIGSQGSILIPLVLRDVSVLGLTSANLDSLFGNGPGAIGHVSDTTESTGSGRHRIWIKGSGEWRGIEATLFP